MTFRADVQPDDMNGWPDPQPIRGELPPVESFSEELLPDSLRPWILDIADRMQVPLDFPGVAAIVSLAGAVGRRATIQPKARDTGWVVVPNLWGGVIGPPGYMKSPVINAVTRPLMDIEKTRHDEHDKALAHYLKDLEEWKSNQTGPKKQLKEASKGKVNQPKPVADRPREPLLRRLVAMDVTFEKLQDIMSENPAGILLIRDELTGWLAEFERNGREGERQFCLTAWNGDTEYTVDRIGRGTVRVPACCLSVLGGIQPQRLEDYLLDAGRSKHNNDGMIQRFQVVAWPDMPTDFQYVDRPPDKGAGELASRVFRRIMEVDPRSPLQFGFTDDAQEIFASWHEDLERTVRQATLPPELISHLSKYRSLMPSLALLFEIADRATGSGGFVGSLPGDTSGFGRVSFDHVMQAYQACVYLESHARRVYRFFAPEIRAARALAERIRQRHVGDSGFFTLREVYLKGWHGLGFPEAVRAAASVLQRAGWIRAVTKGTGPSGGRPSERYDINPKAWRIE